MSPLPMRVPALTITSARYDTDTFNSPAWIVTVFMPATDPAKVTSPPMGARTASPGSADRSTPQ